MRPTCTSKAWCILRLHCHKWVLHSLPVDAGMATPETHQNTPTGQKCSKANLHMKEWCILQKNVCPFLSLLHCIIAGTQCRSHESIYVSSQGPHPVWRENLTHMFGSFDPYWPFICTRTFVRPQAEQGASTHKRKVCKMCMGVTGNLAILTSPNHGG